MRPPWPHLGTLVHDEHLRLAIVDDVGDLWTGEVVVDARQIDTDLHGCQVQLDEAHFVRQDDCYPIASLQTETAQTEENGRKKVVKLGMKAEQRDGSEYELFQEDLDRREKEKDAGSRDAAASPPACRGARRTPGSPSPRGRGSW